MKPKSNEFTGDPWEDVEMPDGFDPDNNKFLNPEKAKERESKKNLEEVVKVVDGIRKTTKFSDGLAIASYYKDGDKEKVTFGADRNAWFGMLLSAAGKRREARDIVARVKSLPLYREDGLVYANCTTERVLSSEIDSHQNMMWGLLLNAAGYREEARQVVASIKNTELYREDGLVYECVKEEGINPMVWLVSNGLWGLLLNAVGYKEEAKKMVDGVKESNLYRDDGLLTDCMHGENVRKEGVQASDAIYLYPDAIWGLLFHAVGYEDDARKVVTAINAEPGMREGGLLKHVYGVGKAPSIVAGTNACWGMLLRATGYGAEAAELKQSLMDSDLYRPDGLVKSDLGELRGNYQWGLFIHKEGYKVLTGEK